MTHLSPEVIAWVRGAIEGYNETMREATSQRAKQAADDARRPLINLLVVFTGADRDELRKLTKEGSSCKP